VTSSVLKNFAVYDVKCYTSSNI